MQHLTPGDVLATAAVEAYSAVHLRDGRTLFCTGEGAAEIVLDRSGRLALACALLSHPAAPLSLQDLATVDQPELADEAVVLGHAARWARFEAILVSHGYNPAHITPEQVAMLGAAEPHYPSLPDRRGHHRMETTK